MEMKVVNVDFVENEMVEGSELANKGKRWFGESVQN